MPRGPLVVTTGPRGAGEYHEAYGEKNEKHSNRVRDFSRFVFFGFRRVVFYGSESGRSDERIGIVCDCENG